MSAIGHFGNAEVIFAFPGQQIPAELAIEFELLRASDKAPALLSDWISRLERKLHRNALPPPWSILRVKPGMERKVRDALGPKTRESPHGAGLSVYYPEERYRPRNGLHARKRPLLPGYIFADLSDDDDLDAARGNHAVLGLLSINGKPVSVPALTVGALILFEACREFDTAKDAKPVRRGGRRSAPLRNWEKGERVRVIDGPFASFPGTIVKADRADRIELLVMIFGRVTPVTMDEAMLEAMA